MPSRWLRHRSSEFVSVIVVLNYPSAANDIGTYYAGESVDPWAWKRAAERIFCCPSFVLGPPSGAGFGWIEHLLLTGWRGRRIDQELRADLHEWLRKEKARLTPEFTVAISEFFQDHLGYHAGVVVQQYRYLMGPIFDAHLEPAVNNSGEGS